MNITLDISSLLMMEKENKETVQEYAQRWREKVAQVESPLLKKEMTNLFSNMFKAPFFDYLVSAPTQHFTDIMIMAERIAAIKVNQSWENSESN